MPHAATTVPDETDLLCEGCGYTLNGLPTGGNCPECGKAIEQSVGIHRAPSEFEISPSLTTFASTSWNVLVHPKEFYRTLTTRTNPQSASLFAHVHRMLASLLFAAAAIGHLFWTFNVRSISPTAAALIPIVVASAPAIYLMLFGLTKLAAWLSAIEARYWGMRLPYQVVQRGLTFHAVHYLPVGFLAAAIVWGYLILRMQHIISTSRDTIYLYTLCAAVIVSAAYLFQTYWIAMRNMMYANR